MIETQSHQKDISIILIHTPKEIEKTVYHYFSRISLVHLFFTQQKQRKSAHCARQASHRAMTKHRLEPGQLMSVNHSISRSVLLKE
jgi:hypothetical protein